MISVGSLFTLFAVVAFGAVIPVVPTGAAVSVAATVASRENPALLVIALAFGAAGAWTGDVVTYGVLRLAGEGLARRVGWLRDGATGETLERLRRELEAHELQSLLLSRLVPGGRVPVLLAAALGGYSWRRFVAADVASASLWSILYGAIGVLGGAIFPETWQAVVAAIALVLLLSAAQTLWQRRRRARAAGVG